MYGYNMDINKPIKLSSDPWGNQRQKNNGNQPPDIDALLRNLFKKMNKGSQGGSISIGIIILVALALWAATGFFVVSEGHTAIVLRFGEFNRELGRGLKWHAPLFETKFIVNTEKISTYEYEAEMLTTDENYARVKVAVLYRVSNPTAFKFNVQDPLDTLKEVTASALRQVVGQSRLEDVLSSGKEVVRSEIEKTVISTLKAYNIGLQIRGVKLLAALPPTQVSEAFEDAIKAREDEQRYINIAEAYHNEILPKAKGRASRITNEASAIKESTILRSKAEVEGFNALVSIYKKDPELLTNRLYIQTMEDVLSKTPKILLNGDQNISYLPLSEILSKQK